MELPQPPKDGDLRNIIDKLAQFVARNGPDFERMTKSKQKNNPKFGFLYGGEHFNYYQYKVTTEQAILKRSGRRDALAEPQWGERGAARQPPAAERPPPPAMGIMSQVALETVVAQQTALKDQIKQSEANLNAQHSVLIQQQQSQTEETVAAAQNETIRRLAAESNIDLEEFDVILQPIVESCTKDSISTGKGWILNRANSREASILIAQYLLKKVTTVGTQFTHKLHIIYLVNDVLHHCARKNAEDLKKGLESVVIPMFCNTSIAITEEQETKLNKLLKLWESKSNYFDQSVIEKMKDPTNSYQEYTAGLISQYANLITPLTQQTKVTFENYQKQHQAFVTHTMQQIQRLEVQKQIFEQQLNISEPNAMPPSNIPPPNFNMSQFSEQMFSPPSSNQVPPFQPPPNFRNNNNPPLFPPTNEQPPFGPPSLNGIQSNNNCSEYDFEPNYQAAPSNPPPTINNNNVEDANLPSINLSQPPPGFFEGAPLPPSFQNGMPDLSKPPPGFSSSPPDATPDELMPSVPYYELPAGLMVPLIMLEDGEYKPLDPESIKLPPPAPPSDRLLAAVKAFYAAPNHTRPQDSEGWEKLGLYEYYRAKNSARKQKEDDIKSGIRQKSKSPSPIQSEHFPIKSLPTRRYRSKSRSPSRERSRSKSPITRNRSMSPDRRNDRRRPRHTSAGGSPPVHSPMRSYNRRGSPEPEERTCGSEAYYSRPERISNRSPPPDPNSGVANSELDSTNKGHQMLRKMGWTQGAGLGATGQGIVTPVSASARDKDPCRDINMSDPYENFRKNKGAAFITRMKERALERSS